jgi:ribosomal protein S18 acetylase RimI-like enzyme
MRKQILQEPHLLSLEQSRGMKFEIFYETNGYYGVQRIGEDGVFGFYLRLQSFEHPVTKSFTIELAPVYYEGVADYILSEGGQMIALLEYYHEGWNNRLRITELWVHEDYRRQGIALQLLNFAKKHAMTTTCREIVLETQSCNLPAIACYLKFGFQFTGIDTTCYSNHDIERKEVRLEMGLSLLDEDSIVRK